MQCGGAIDSARLTVVLQQQIELIAVPHVVRAQFFSIVERAIDCVADDAFVRRRLRVFHLVGGVHPANVLAHHHLLVESFLAEWALVRPLARMYSQMFLQRAAVSKRFLAEPATEEMLSSVPFAANCGQLTCMRMASRRCASANGSSSLGGC